MLETTNSPATGAFKTSPSIGAIAAALAKAQIAIEGASKDKTNPAFRSKYADLSSVQEACRDALATNNIAVIQSPGDGEAGRVTLTTLLAHASGEWICGAVSAPVSKNDAQAVGSAITYLRRYSLAAMVGVAPEDDDGNAASGRDDRGSYRQAEERREPPRTESRTPANGRSHDPSWEAARAAFCATLTNEFGLDYNDVAAWCEADDRKRPSTMNRDERAALYVHLKSPQGLASIGDFLKRTITHKPAPRGNK